MKKVIFFTLVAYTTFYAAEKEITSTSDGFYIGEFAEEAALSKALFSDFRRRSPFRDVIETCAFAQGWEFLQSILELYPHLLNSLDEFRKNDGIGLPFLFPYAKYGYFSPTTLRYILIGGHLEAEFGSLDGKTIVEIGGGYGGQCRILSALFSIKEYVLIDLPGALKLAEKYLDFFGLKNVRLIPYDEIKDPIPSDLLISNYAFSECTESVQKMYVEKILNHAKSGYMICNDYGYFNRESLKAHFGKNLRFCNEIPQTAAVNYVITWKE